MFVMPPIDNPDAPIYTWNAPGSNFLKLMSRSKHWSILCVNGGIHVFGLGHQVFKWGHSVVWHRSLFVVGAFGCKWGHSCVMCVMGVFRSLG